MFGSVGVGWSIAGAVGSAVIGVIPSCNVSESGEVTVTYGQHHLLVEGVQFEGDLVSGDRLDIIMNPEGDTRARCDHMGGRLELHLPDAVDEVGQVAREVCAEVDF
jgi:hypothetical protein